MEQDIYTDVMCDIESTGVRPDENGILQISAVKFNMHTRAVKADDMFDRCLTIPENRPWDHSTKVWWNTGPKQKILPTLIARAEDHVGVMNAFADWAFDEQQRNGGNQLRFWAKPITFDFMFISSYFKDLDIPNPFHYRAATDLNSFLTGLYYPAPVADMKVEFSGSAHNALHDTLHQIKVLFAHLDSKK